MGQRRIDKASLSAKETPTRIRTAVLLYMEQIVRDDLTTNKEAEATCTPSHEPTLVCERTCDMSRTSWWAEEMLPLL